MAKATARKAPVVKKAVPAKGAVKKAAPGKTMVQKTVAKRTAGKQAAPAKAATKQTVAKKAVVRKTVAKTGAVKKTPVKTAAKKAGTAKAVVKKTVAKKIVSKKAAPAKTVANKTVAKKTVGKKAAPTKGAAKVAVKSVVKPEPKAPPVKKQPAGQTCPLSGIFVPKQSPNITPKTMERLREILDEERERHVRQAADLQADADALVNEREQGDTQFDEESGEGDTISVERERDLMMSATARLAVEEIDRALERMTSGGFGLCSPAGRRIPVARLEAIPWAETCVDCKQRVERRR